MNDAVKLEDEADYEAVVEELRRHVRREGLWARAVAEADGDIAKAQARYIRYRVAAMQEERRVKKEEALKTIRIEQEKKTEGWIAGVKILLSATAILSGLVILFRGCFHS